MKKLLFFFIISFSITTLLAKTTLLDEGKKFIYYEKYQSAIDVLKKYIQDKPKDESAYYYLALSYINLRKYDEAKEILDQGIKIRPNKPMLLVGYGHLELIKKNDEAAKNFFENAIADSRQKDIEVYTAIAVANSGYKIGDANYAINKLRGMKEMTKKTPEFYLAVGDLYRKMLDGGNAVSSYISAFQFDNKLAAAKYKIGRVYITQGNFAVFNSYFQEAISIDPKYAPVYYELYRYYYNIDVNKAREYYEKFKANTDKGSRIEYEYASLLFASKSYQASLDSLKSLFHKYPEDIDPRWYGLETYCYDKLNKPNSLYESTRMYESLEDINRMDAGVFSVTAENYLKDKKTFDSGIVYYQKAHTYDTSRVNKVNYLKSIAKAYKEVGNRNKQAYWLGMAYSQNPKASYSDLYSWGIAAFMGQNYQLSDSIFEAYTKKYPDQFVGYYWRGRVNTMLDTTFTDAIPHFTKYIEIASVDSIKNKSALITAYGIMAAYNVNTVKDFHAALGFFDKILNLEPKNKSATTYKQYVLDVIKQKEEYEQKKKEYEKRQALKAKGESSKKRK